MLLEIRNLRVYYGGVDALKSVSLQVNAEEFVGVLGANGSGKSTLIRAITGLKPAYGGEVKYNNEVITKYSPQKIFSLGIATIPEGRRLFPRMNVAENLLMGCNLISDKKLIKQSMEKVFEYYPKLEKRRNQKVGTLSGGEQQMVAIGRALMSNSKLLLLDEPSMGLAPILVREMFRILDDVSRNGTAILIAEQNVHETLEFVQRAYVLEIGSVLMSGDADEVRNSDDVRKTYLGGE